MKKLFLAWQDPQSRRWFPIGKLTFDGENYHFSYTHGVKKAQKESNFQLLYSFPELERDYISSELFPLFSNRLMRPSRPDYKEYIQSLNIPENEAEPFGILVRSEGRKATDTLEIFPCPEPNKDGIYYIHFFARGLRHMPKDSLEKIKELQAPEHLYVAYDFQNRYDSKALLLRTEQYHNLGYCPRYLAENIYEVWQDNPASIIVSVERVNFAPTPIQYRLLCKMTLQCPRDFSLFSSQDYQSIVDSSLTLQKV